MSLGSSQKQSSIDINDYCTFVAIEDGLTISFTSNSNECLEYCIDGRGDWKILEAGVSTPAINKEHTISFRGEFGLDHAVSTSGIGKFTTNAKFNLIGSCYTLYYGEFGRKSMWEEGLMNMTYYYVDIYAFKNLFNGTKVVNVDKDFLYYDVVTPNCYYSMFRECTYLKNAPALPATSVASNCYAYMFYGCTSLTAAPVLPAKTLAGYCYHSMFRGCKNLKTTPDLPVVSLADYCCAYMFYGCSSLTAAPALPAKTLTPSCYYLMFYNCSSLTTVPALPATTLASNCYYGMFRYCTTLETAPALPAITLTTNCYSYMFYGCSLLSYVSAAFTTTPGTGYTDNWLSSVAADGTFVKNIDASWDVSGASGIPTNWTIETKTFN